MNILLVVGTLSGRGGIETCIRNMAQEAVRNGDMLHVLALCPSTVDGQWHEGLSYREVESGSDSLKWQAFKGIPAICAGIRRRAPDVIVVIYSSTIPLVKISLALTRSRVPVVSWLHFSSFLPQRTRLLKYADGHLCINSDNFENLVARRDIPPARVHLIFNGTRISGMTTIPRSPSDAPLRIVYVGRLMVGLQKRTEELIQALARLEGNWFLDVFGSGDDLEALQELARTEGIAEKIAWRGWRQDPWDALETADLLVLCSAFEGFPMVLLEAMARGIPCISSDCRSGPSDIVRDGVNGWLYPVGDREALTALLNAVIKERDLLPRPEVVQTSVERFDISHVYARFKSGLAEIVSQVEENRQGVADPKASRH
jgi:UDP-D-galactose:(glucosyl)LPS alpha-1,6-D-galactosyltransferase